MGTSADELEVPDFIYECRRTLDEIQVILNKFAHIGGSSTRDLTKTSRLSRLRSFEPKDLKWPLSSKKTEHLLQALERHKSTCTIALAQDGMIGIHAVLKETKLSNKYLAEIRANQQTMVELQLTQVQGEFTSSYPCPLDLLRSLLGADNRSRKSFGMAIAGKPDLEA